jgi:DNA polymerase IV
MTSERASPGRTHRRILLVDCDMFFVQVARMEDPDGAGRTPLLIVGGSSTGRGVVTSASYEVRRFGVRSGMPTATALRLCPEATVVGVPREACSRRSRDVREALEALAPVVQAASIDEFYLDLSGTERLWAGESFIESARRIRLAVKERTGVSVSIGGGSNRLIAKLAARRAKPAGEFVVPPGGEGAFLRELELEDLPGVGPALLATLRKQGFHRVEELLPVPESVLAQWVGENRAAWLHSRIRGVDSTAVVTGEPRKSVSAERTFRRDIDDDDRLEAILLKLATRVGAALRSEGLRARTVTVKIRDGDFTTRSGSRSVDRAVESDHALFDLARPLLASLRSRRRMGARLLGLGAGNLTEDDEPGQLGLFPEEGSASGDTPVESPRDRAISRAVDDLNSRFGRQTILPARIVPPDPDLG